MSDYRDRLEQERRRFAMSGDSFQDLERRRDRKRRNRRLASGAVALAIAVVGVGGALYAFRPTESVGPAVSPSTPSSTVTSPGPSPSGTVLPPLEAAQLSPSGPIQFVDDQHGWMVDQNGQILATSNGGSNWVVQLSAPSTVFSVEMFDAQHGWALFTDGVLQTTDGGATWVTWSNESLSSIQFVSLDMGWGVSSNPTFGHASLMLTEDGGKTWEAQGLLVDSICLGTDGRLWAAGTSGDGGGVSVFRRDAGQENVIETPLPIPSGEPWTAAIRCSGDGSEAFALVTGGGAAGHVAYAAFQVTAGPGTSDDLHPVLVASFAAAELGLDAYQDDDPYPGVFTVVGPGRAYFINWCPACEGAWASFVPTQGEPALVTDRTAISPSGNPSQPEGISFVDPDHGWMLLQSGLVLETKDGGKTWDSPCDASCFGVSPSP